MSPYSLNWPSKAERLFLQACLLPANRAVSAYREYRVIAAPEAERSVKPFLPVLLQHFEEEGISEPSLAGFKKDYDLIRMTHRMHYEQSKTLLERLSQSGFEILTLKGFALMELCYAYAVLRPMSDVDIYVRPQDLEGFVRHMTETAGAKVCASEPWQEIRKRHHAVPFLADENKSIDLHWNIFWEFPSQDLDRNLWEHAERLSSERGTLRRLCAADQLVLTICHGLRANSKSPLRWILDAAWLMRQKNAVLDWERVVETAQKAQVTEIVHEALTDLKENYSQNVPDAVLTRLVQTRVSRGQRRYLRTAYDQPRTLLEAVWFFWRQNAIRYHGQPWTAQFRGFVRNLGHALEARTLREFLKKGAAKLRRGAWLFEKRENARQTPPRNLFVELLKRAGLKPRHFILPAFFSLAAAALEGGVIGLLVPAGRGLIEGNFNFIYSSRLLKPLVWVHDTFTPSSRMSFFGILIGGMLAMIAAENLFDYFSRLGFAANTAKFQNTLRKAVCDSYLSSGKYFFDQQNAGHLNHVLMLHTQRVALTLDFLQMALRSAFLLAAYVTLMACLSWPLLLTVSIAFPCLHLVLRKVIGQMSRISLDTAQAENELSAKVHNLLSSMTLLKAYRAEAEQAGEFAKMSDACARLFVQMNRRKLAIEPIMEVVAFSVYLLAAALAGFFILPNKPGSAAAFLAFIVILRRASSSFGIFSRVRASAADSAGPLQEVVDFIRRPGKFAVPQGAKIFRGLEREIRFEHLAFSYPGGREVLKDIHFSAPKGSLTALVGPTGSGKTTLIHLLMRFYDCAPGSIFLDETDIRDLTLDSLLGRMAIVEQEPSLFNDTLKQNLLFGIREPASTDRLAEVLQRAELEDMVQALPQGLETRIGDHGVKLSGGEKQRVAIARAMLKNPDILILDEATSALDSKTESRVQKALAELVKGRTSLVIAHRLSTILQADRILVLSGGEIREQGSLRELLAREGIFYELWQHQKLMETILAETVTLPVEETS